VKIIDVESWDRKQAYQLFRHSQNPHFGMTAAIEVNYLMKDIKASGASIFNYTVYALSMAANDIPALRRRFDSKQVFELATTNPSFTVPTDKNNFAFCHVKHNSNWEMFDRSCKQATSKAIEQNSLEETDNPLQWTYMTCAPWLHFTGMTHPTSGPDDCIPRLAWGQIKPKGEGFIMPLNIQLHHALADGFHVAEFFEKAEKYLNN
jgi:chloramphenicol O-acetyltransferase type A